LMNSQVAELLAIAAEDSPRHWIGPVVALPVAPDKLWRSNSHW
jgi:hypothetical protein